MPAKLDNMLVCLLIPQKDGSLGPYKSTLVRMQRKPEVVTLSEADVQRMKADAHVLTAEERTSLRHALEEQKEHERAAAKARKEKMLRLEAEAKQQVCSRATCEVCKILERCTWLCPVGACVYHS